MMPVHTGHFNALERSFASFPEQCKFVKLQMPLDSATAIHSTVEWIPFEILWPCNRTRFHRISSPATFYCHAATASQCLHAIVFSLSLSFSIEFMQEHTVYYSNKSHSNKMWFEIGAIEWTRGMWRWLLYTLFDGVFFCIFYFGGLINECKKETIHRLSLNRQISWVRLNWFHWSDGIPSPTTSHGKNWCKTNQIELSRFQQPKPGLIKRASPSKCNVPCDLWYSWFHFVQLLHSYRENSVQFERNEKKTHKKLV